MSVTTRRLLTIVTTALVGAVGTAPAFAQQQLSHPRLAPSRDVSVIYSVQPEKMSKPVQATVQFKAEGDKLRIDSSDHSGSTILDRPAQQVTLVMHKQRIYTSFSPKHGLRNPFMLDLSMNYTPNGTGVVAGLSCNKWTITSTHGQALACVTEDGVILSEDGVDSDGLQGKLQAQSVTYGPLQDSLFQPPADYQKIIAKFSIPHGGAKLSSVKP